MASYPADRPDHQAISLQQAKSRPAGLQEAGGLLRDGLEQLLNLRGGADLRVDL